MTEKRKKLIIVGSGETAELAYEYFTYDSDYEVIGFSVSQQYLTENKLHNLPIVPFEKVEEYFSVSDVYAFVALASGHLNRDRMKMYYATKSKGYRLASYVSSHVFIWRNVTIGDNCFIMENNVLQPFTSVGNNVVMWSGNHLGHRSIIKDNCFISSHCVISGFCEIGEGSYLGVNSTIADNVKIAKNNYIAMGAIIGKSTKANCMYSGTHAKNMQINTLKYFGVEE